TLAAALFRPEMLVYLALGPMGLLLDNRVDWRERCKRTLQTLALVVGLSALVLVLGYAAGVNLAEVVQRAITVYEPFLSSTARSLDSFNSPISEAVFGEYAADYSGQYIALFVITGLSAILILKLITGFGLPALLLLLQGLRSDT